MNWPCRCETDEGPERHPDPRCVLRRLLEAAKIVSEEALVDKLLEESRANRAEIKELKHRIDELRTKSHVADLRILQENGEALERLKIKMINSEQTPSGLKIGILVSWQ